MPHKKNTMAIGAGGAAAITAAGAVIGQGTNAWAQGKMNKKTRKFSEMMYNKQRADNLADWAMQNEYNSPRAQMQRYQEAGLNPHLIYGQSHTADAVRSADAPTWSPRAPQMDINPGSIMANYFDARQKTAQMDLVAAQVTATEQQSILTAANTAKALQDTAKSRFELDLASDLRETSLQAAQASLDKTIAETTVTLNRDEREAASNAMSIKEAAERILTMRLNRTKTPHEIQLIKSQIANLSKDNELKELDARLKRQGIQPGDNVALRWLAQKLEGTSTTPYNPDNPNHRREKDFDSTYERRGDYMYKKKH